MYAVLSALMNPRSNPHRPSHYDHLFHDKGLDKIQYPVSIADIPAVEDQLHLNINVFTFFDDAGRARQPLYTSKKIFLDFIFLHYFDEHFVWIKKFGAFMADSAQPHNLLVPRMPRPLPQRKQF